MLLYFLNYCFSNPWRRTSPHPGVIPGEKFPSLDNLIIGELAGTSGSIGLVALHRGLSLERMSIVAPVAAVVTVILPIIDSCDIISFILFMGVHRGEHCCANRSEVNQ